MIIDLNIDNLYSLTTISGLQNLKVIIIDLVIKNNNSLIDFCGLQSFLTNNRLEDSFDVYNNTCNSTKLDIIDGNCSL